MSGLLDSLPVLPDITGRSAYPTTKNSGGVMYNASVGGVPSPEAIYNTDGTKKREAGNKDTGFNFSTQSIVFIVLGLLFIAGGIFAFREVRQTIVSGVKTAAKAAPAVAAIA